MTFRDRVDAGRRLADALQRLVSPQLVVLGLPRGGVVVAGEVAERLGAPLDVILVRKLGAPFQPELAMGAVGEGNVRVLDEDLIRSSGISPHEIEAEERKAQAEIARQARLYRGGRRQESLEGKIALIVDDGVATGATARAACRIARAHGAALVVLAVPVAPPGWERRIGTEADECVALRTPGHFFAIGEHYDDFAPTPTDEVVRLLASATSREAP